MKKTLQPHQGKLEEIIFDDNANMWDFKWTGEVRLLTGVFWRLFENDKVQTISSDHSKVWAYKKPRIDLIEKLKDTLESESLIEAETTDENDLILTFTNKIYLRFYVSSMAFENWELTIKSSQYICLQGGYEIAVVN